jgi:hypothetical protein
MAPPASPDLATGDNGGGGGGRGGTGGDGNGTGGNGDGNGGAGTPTGSPHSGCALGGSARDVSLGALFAVALLVALARRRRA